MSSRPNDKGSSKFKIKTFIRIKPTAENSKEAILFNAPEKGAKYLSLGLQRFQFDYILPSSSSQEDVYNNAVLPLVNSVIQGYNATVFAFGPTGSGKTFTIVGSEKSTDDQLEGIIPRALKQILAIKDNRNVTCRYVQIYEEEMSDLLNNDKTIWPFRKNLNMNIAREEPISIENYKTILKRGADAKKYRATALNKHSSRSHCIFTIIVKDPGSKKSAEFNIVDLAGTECIEKSKVEGQGRAEAKSINLSLCELNKVVLNLSQGKFDSCRNSQLTWALHDSLHGNCKTILIATIENKLSSEHSIKHTLSFAVLTRKITTVVEPNIVIQPKYKLSRLEQLLERIKNDKTFNPKNFPWADYGFSVEENSGSEREKLIINLQNQIIELREKEMDAERIIKQNEELQMKFEQNQRELKKIDEMKHLFKKIFNRDFNDTEILNLEKIVFQSQLCNFVFQSPKIIEEIEKKSRFDSRINQWIFPKDYIIQALRNLYFQSYEINKKDVEIQNDTIEEDYSENDEEVENEALKFIEEEIPEIPEIPIENSDELVKDPEPEIPRPQTALPVKPKIIQNPEIIQMPQNKKDEILPINEKFIPKLKKEKTVFHHYGPSFHLGQNSQSPEEKKFCSQENKITEVKKEQHKENPSDFKYDLIEDFDPFRIRIDPNVKKKDLPIICLISSIPENYPYPVKPSESIKNIKQLINLIQNISLPQKLKNSFIGLNQKSCQINNEIGKKCLEIYLNFSEFVEKLNNELANNSINEFDKNYLSLLWIDQFKNSYTAHKNAYFCGFIPYKGAAAKLTKDFQYYLPQFTLITLDERRAQKYFSENIEFCSNNFVPIFISLEINNEFWRNKYMLENNVDILLLPMYKFIIIAVEIMKINIKGNNALYYSLQIKEIENDLYSNYKASIHGLLPQPQKNDNSIIIDFDNENEKEKEIKQENEQEPFNIVPDDNPNLDENAKLSIILPKENILSYTDFKISEKYQSDVLKVYPDLNLLKIKYPKDLVNDFSVIDKNYVAEWSSFMFSGNTPGKECLKLYTTERGQFYNKLNLALAEDKFELFIKYMVTLFRDEYNLKELTEFPQKIVYRGMKIKRTELNEYYKVGESFYCKAFLSTSFSKNIANSFIKSALSQLDFSSEIPIFLIIKINSDIKWNKYDLKHVSVFNEQELLYLPYTKFKVLSKRQELKYDSIYLNYDYVRLELQEENLELYGKCAQYISEVEHKDFNNNIISPPVYQENIKIQNNPQAMPASKPYDSLPIPQKNDSASNPIINASPDNSYIKAHLIENENDKGGSQSYQHNIKNGYTQNKQTS